MGDDDSRPESRPKRTVLNLEFPEKPQAVQDDTPPLLNRTPGKPLNGKKEGEG